MGAGLTARTLALDATRLDAAYDALLAEYGPQGWWPVDGPPETAALEVCVGAILVQHARWESAAAALARLRDADAASLKMNSSSAGPTIGEPSGFDATGR